MKSALSIDEIRELTAYQLSSMADTGSPDSLESPGAELLASARDWYLEHREEIHDAQYPEDVIASVAGIDANCGGAVTYLTYTMMCAFTDLQLWNWDLLDDGILGEITWEYITDTVAIVEGEVALHLVHELYGADDFADLESGEGDESDEAAVVTAGKDSADA